MSKVPVDALGLLQGLTDEDRAWIVARLPTAAKSQLLQAGQPPRNAESSGRKAASEAEQLPAVTGEPADVLENVAPKTLLAILKDEPAWITAALLQAHAWTWSTQLLDALPAVLHADVATLERAKTRFTPEVAQSVRRLIAARVAAGQRDDRASSKFATLLDRLSASRVRKRMVFHP
jgi:hypothetical protein